LKGDPLSAYRNAAGSVLELSGLGASIVKLTTPDSAGAFADVVLGYHHRDSYRHDVDYHGRVVGRFANRIANARFSIDGEQFELEPNDGNHLLHGGAEGFGHRVWDQEDVVTADGRGQRFSLVSIDGDQGFPGRVTATASYIWNDNNELIIEFEARTTRPTPFNITQHAYWNLGGPDEDAILAHCLRVDADHFLPVDEKLIPTGDVRSVLGTPFDLRAPRPIGDCLAVSDPQLEQAGGFDHCWVLNGQGFRRVAELFHPASGRRLAVSTDQPGLQVYSGNGLATGLAGKSGKPYCRHGGIALETQKFPDAPNHAHFPDAILRPDRPFRSRTTFSFSCD
jgi:aldose 1-epimerase